MPISGPQTEPRSEPMPEASAPAAVLAWLGKPEAGRLSRAGALAVISALIWPAQAALVGLAIGALVDPGQALTLSPLTAGLGFVALAAVRLWLDARAQRLTSEAAQAIVVEARRRLIGQAARQAQGSAALEPSALASLAAEKLGQLAPWATRYRAAMLRARIVPLALIALAATQSWAAALIFVIATPLIPLFMALVGMAAQEASERQMVEIGGLNRLLVDRIAAITDLRLLGATARSQADLAVRTEDLRRRTMAVLRIAFLSSTVLELFAAIGVALIAVYVGFSLIGYLNFGTWGQPMTAAQGIFLLMIAPEVFQPLRDLAAAWHDRAAALAVASEIAQAEAGIGAAGTILGRGDTGHAPAPATLRWSSLCIVPAKGAAPLTPPDGSVAPGEAVAITGPSGVGKSSLLAALAGLSPVHAGRIALGEYMLDADNADDWRAALGWIPQTPRFADASLRDLITGGTPGDPGPALAAAAAGDIAASLPEGLDTRLGDLGGGVSGGEARRLLIARAHFAGRPLVLADEPTSDLDPDTAQQVIAGLLALRDRGAALVVATHDPQLIAAMDRAIPLEDR